MRDYKHSLDSLLNTIYCQGDMDECSIKHLGHGLASLITYDTWRQTLDYDYPWGGIEIPVLIAKISEEWEEVTKIMNAMGKEAFYNTVITLPAADYLEFYLSGNWGYPRPEFLK